MGFLENIADSLFKKYFTNSKVECQSMEIKKSDNEDYPILMKGIDCTGTAGPLKFDVPKAYTSVGKLDMTESGIDAKCKTENKSI